MLLLERDKLKVPHRAPNPDLAVASMRVAGAWPDPAGDTLADGLSPLPDRQSHRTISPLIPPHKIFLEIQQHHLPVAGVHPPESPGFHGGNHESWPDSFHDLARRTLGFLWPGEMGTLT